jgi:hypothetical protein
VSFPRRLALVAAAVLAWPASATALTSVKVGDFPWPTYVTAPRGDAHRLFVVEKGGRIEVLHARVRKPFLDIGPKIDTTEEKGLLSMAFAPDYVTSGRFYVYYTAARAGDPHGDVLTVAEYRRSAADPDRADPASRRIVLTVDNPSGGADDPADHNGGQLQFGPDGLLYAATGDGGGHDYDPDGSAQDPASLLGKVLRIDPRVGGAKPEVYASGLRNPWRFSFDRLTGDLVIADVGESAWEEVDVARRGTPAGANYGWSCREAFAPAPGTCAPGSLTDPVFAYPHPENGCSAITGGYVVRDRELGPLYGRYVYDDYCGTGEVRSLDLARPKAGGAPTGLVWRWVVSFGEDSCGHVYLATRGEVRRLVEGQPRPCPGPPDRTPPRLTVARRYRQHLDPHRSLYVTARCDERCTAVATARIPVPDREKPFKARASASLAAGRRTELRLLLSRGAGRAVRRAMKGGQKVTATLQVVARDAAGNDTIEKREIRLVP